MSKILDRYASAVRSSNLRSKEATVYSDSDVLGAVGLAGKDHPLAVALARLFAGDNHAVLQIVEISASIVWGRAKKEHVKLRWWQAQDLARAVLAWHRDGRCRTCGGHGFQVIPNTRTLGDVACLACKGSGLMPFNPQFAPEHVAVARWLLSEIEREQSKAGPAAMAKLAERMDDGS